jgi:hypothetical protein
MKKDDLHIRKINDSEVEMTGADDNFTLSVEKGVTADNLDIKMITFWSFITVAFMLAMIIGSYKIYTYWGFRSSISQAINTQYKDLSLKRASDANHLTTYGMVDGDSGVYRIPIDSAIDAYVQEQSAE